MAIGNGSKYYTPPASILQMTEDLAYLPAYFSEEGDVLWGNRKLSPEFLEERERVFGLRIPVLTEAEWESAGINRPEPWGWSPRMCYLLKDRVVWQEEMRDLYSRRLARTCLQKLCERLSFVSREIIPQVCFSVEEVKRYAKSDCFVIKAPWSSSGKGLLMTGEAGITPKSGEWLRGILKRQGYVMVERHLEKETDFAMEFYCDGRHVSFVGYSLFYTGEGGEYKGNFVGDQTQLEAELRRKADEKDILAVRNEVIKVLEDLLIPVYQGYVGVDMMIYRSSDGILSIQPCVEINLRYNMGILAFFLNRRYLARHAQGFFSVSHYAKSGEALNAHREMQQKMPLVMKKGRISCGYVNLTPVEEKTHFLAALEVRK